MVYSVASGIPRGMGVSGYRLPKVYEGGGGGEDPKEELETKPEPEQKGNPPQVDDPIFSDTNFLLLLFPLVPIFSSLQTPN